MLEAMVLDKSYNTESSYSSNSELYPDNVQSFIDKHMNYINTHPDTNIEHYLSNLRLMTRIQ